ncbi:MAG: class I SAM-dependent methyltransferase [Deltaproteobacteria bacterium]|nr:class I SAM-dependent methyltransferase [Deltaproteobacteria bacterium]
MDTAVIRAINRLWLPVYPGLARQAAEQCSQQPRRILEVGCFSGGTAFELLNIFPDSTVTIALELPGLAASFFQDWRSAAADRSRICIISTPLVPLALHDAVFDLVACRGVFFFLDEKAELLAELFRVCAPGGAVFAGGGFGSSTPQSVIAPIADKSRRLNYALGKKVVSPKQFRTMLERNGLGADILHDGGLWALIQK